MEKILNNYAFIDASNLFYGGKKSLGWKIDYQKLFIYLQKKYNVSKVFYFGGVETYNFKFDYLNEEKIPIDNLEKYIVDLIKERESEMTGAMILLLNKHLQRIHFYLKLKDFGYNLFLKPIKSYEQEDGTIKRKANCDVDMTLQLMKEKENFDSVIILSGDGDFLPVLKELKNQEKRVIVLARGPRTAKEVRQFAGSDFRDFEYLKYILKMSKG